MKTKFTLNVEVEWEPCLDCEVYEEDIARYLKSALYDLEYDDTTACETLSVWAEVFDEAGNEITND